MSMDIIIWAACSLSLPGDLPEPESWKNYGRASWAHETPAWQVVVEPAPGLTAPAEVMAINAEAGEAMYASVEPIRAGEDAYRFLNSVAVAVATRCGGAILQGPMGIVLLDADGKELRG